MATGFYAATQYMQTGQECMINFDQVNEQKFIGPENFQAPTLATEDFINEMTFDEVSQIYDLYKPLNPLALMTYDEMACPNPESIMSELGDFSLKEAYLAFNLRESYLQRQANSCKYEYDAIIQTTDDFETKTKNIYKNIDKDSDPDTINCTEKVSLTADQILINKP